MFLGIYSALIGREKKTTLPWYYLSIFAFLHSANEWMEMIKIGVGENIYTNVLRLFFLTSSFLFLFGFARRYYGSQIRISKGFLIYLPIIVVLVLGWLYAGERGFIVFVRYILGAGGAFAVSVIFWDYSRSINFFKLKFKLISVFFGLYSLSLLVVPGVEFLNIKYTEQQAFFDFFGFPIQLIRPIIVFIVTILLWQFYQGEILKELSAQQKIKYYSNGIKIIILFSLVAVLGAGLCNFFGNYANYRVNITNTEHSYSLNGNLESFLTKGNDLSLVISGSLPLITALSAPNEKNITAAHSALDRFCKVSDISICYILNNDGVTIATSNRNAPDSLLGLKYAFRSYFYEAIQGQHATLFAVGVTTMKPGYYSSYPVHSIDGKIIGVAVIKMDLDRIQEQLNYYEHAYLTSPEGVIFLSSNGRSFLQSLAPLTNEVKQRLYDAQQFSHSKFEPLFEKRITDGDKIILDNITHKVFILEVSNTKWSLVLLTSTEIYAIYRLFGIVISLIFFIIIISIIITLQNIRRNLMSSYYTSAVYTSNDAIIGKDLNGIITSWNIGAENIYGYKKDEVVGKNVSILFSPEKSEENLVMLKKIYAGSKVSNIETEQITKNDQLINVFLTVSVIEDSDGQIIGTSTVARDITRQKKAEDKLKKVTKNLELKNTELNETLAIINQQRIKTEQTNAAILNLMEDLNVERDQKLAEIKKDEALIQSIGDGIIATDRSGFITLINPAFEKMLGFSRDELINKKYSVVVKAEEVKGGKIAPTDRDVYAVLSSGEKIVRPLNEPIIYLKKDGVKLLVAVTTAPIKVGNNLMGAIIVVRDISREYAIDKAKTEFVSLASHQLRTPLTAISWFTEMLLRKTANFNKYQKEYLNEIYQSGRRMAELVNALLNVSRIEMGTFSIEPKECSLKEIAKTVVNDVQVLLKKKKIKLKEVYDAKLPHINGDPQLINIIFQNLLSNAIKYTKPIGKISLEVLVKKATDFPDKKLDTQFQDLILIKVTDDGVGIPADAQSKIFTKLYRADNAKIADPAGSGLGLYIVKSILDNSGGRIWFESIENKGTKFYVVMPISGMIKKEGSKILI